ncbi:MAG: N-acetyl-gamma-glutamyl-phosphate reductase [Bacteroidales bacterium]
MIKVGIIGGAGYTAGELLRLLINHPEVEIKWINSSSNAGNAICDVHKGLIGETELRFTSELDMASIDLLYCCTPHGDTKKFMESNTIPEHIKIIDLSTDYRKEDGTHDFVYGLPELNLERIEKAKYVANPGCFATAIQMALLPLAKAGMLTSDIHINAITGSTGAGVKPSTTSHFSWRNNNISIYKPFTHQHLSEIRQSLTQLQADFTADINFLPVRGCFARGIFVSAYLNSDADIDTVRELFADYYKDEQFTHVSDKMPDLKDVVNTNKCIVNVSKEGNKILIVSVIDNLLKGASGQAVQNMNIIFGLPQRTGLNLKPSAF